MANYAIVKLPIGKLKFLRNTKSSRLNEVPAKATKRYHYPYNDILTDNCATCIKGLKKWDVSISFVSAPPYLPFKSCLKKNIPGVRNLVMMADEWAGLPIHGKRGDRYTGTLQGLGI